MKKVIIVVILLFWGFMGGAITVWSAIKRRFESTGKKAALYEGCYNVMCQWVGHKQMGISLEEYFLQKDYQSVAIYGMGRMGIMLYEELENSDILVKYGIDRSLYCACPGLKIVQPDSKLEEVDVIVVTPIMAFDEIAKMMRKITNIPLISIEDIIYGL